MRHFTQECSAPLYARTLRATLRENTPPYLTRERSKTRLENPGQGTWFKNKSRAICHFEQPINPPPRSCLATTRSLPPSIGGGGAVLQIDGFGAPGTTGTDPDTLNVAREPNKHLAFGLGPHFCLGAPLARLEGQIAINTLLRRIPEMRLTGAPDVPRWRRGLLLRGLESLPVAFGNDVGKASGQGVSKVGISTFEA